MEIDDYQPLLRRRRNSYLKWTESQVLEFLELVLDLVKDVPESLEKPTAQKFYAKMVTNRLKSPSPSTEKVATPPCIYILRENSVQKSYKLPPF
ncbi:hypothetical protein ACLKA7_007351 [Drosophila subpalustris]